MSETKRRRRRRRLKGGDVLNCTNPDWEPLLRFARVYVDEFMWMHEVVLEDEARLHAYKNYWTRRYIHLDDRGRAFFFCDERCYEEIPEDEVREFFDRVMRRPGPSLGLG
jgi:hypothetical protein